jgi:hypothetical protein
MNPSVPVSIAHYLCVHQATSADISWTAVAAMMLSIAAIASPLVWALIWDRQSLRM